MPFKPVKSTSRFKPVAEPKEDLTAKRVQMRPDEYGERFGAAPETGPSIQEVIRRATEVGKGAIKGAIGGILGFPGEVANIPRTVEQIARTGVRGLQETKVPGITSTAVKGISAILGMPKTEREPIIPRIPAGVPEVTKGLFGESESEAEELGRFVGEVTAPIGTTLKLGAAGTRRFIGEVPPTREAVARSFEKRGYTLDPAQLRADRPIKTAGPTLAARENNEKLATKEASRETGVETQDINPEFISSRTDALGKDYNKIFNRNFTIDTDAARTLLNIAKFESEIYPAGVGPVRSTVQNIVTRWKDALTEAKLKQIQNQTQRIIDQQQRGGVSRWKRDWPTLVSPTDANAPEWLSGVQSKVNDLSKQLGLSRVPEVYAGTPRRSGLYGMATGDGYIMIRSDLNRDGALATALHEFGHQADFQYFRNQPPEVQRQLVSSWMDETSRIPFGTKTIEQLRPITSQKYGEARLTTPTPGADRGYFRNFAEWYAEQTSRWLTQTKKPTNVIEQYFAGAANNWNQVYSRVVGYTPKTEEVERFFNAAWRDPETAGLTIQTAAQPAMRAAPEVPVLPLENVTAPISGLELQRLRSNLTDLARRETDGQKRFAISSLIQKIDDDIIAKSDPRVLPMLQNTNRKYAATAALAEGIRQGWVTGGRVDLSGLGNYVAGELPPIQFGSGTARHPLYDLGYGGREIGLTSRAAGQVLPGSEVAQAVMGGKLAAARALGQRTQVARAAQRAVSEKELRRMQAEQAARAGRSPRSP